LNKIFPSIQQAIVDLADGATIMIGGLEDKGIPQSLIQALYKRGAKNLTIVSHDLGSSDRGVKSLLEKSQVKKLIAASVGGDYFFEDLVKKGELQIELNALGTFSERIRAGGGGIGGFFTPTAFGTILAGNKETRVLNGKNCILELPLKANFAFVKAWKGDRFGNLIYEATSRNFNPTMATAAEITIAEVEELVLAGQLDPNHIHTPGIYVQRVVQKDIPAPAHRLDRDVEDIGLS
jgi:3-oxoacid CoA-transferase A subunit